MKEMRPTQNIGFRVALSICFVLLSAVSSMAQNDGNVSMYWATPTYFNAATAGRDSAMNIAGFERMQWVGVKGAPQTTFISVDMPFQFLKKRHGAGVNLINDKAGLFSTTIISAQYSFSKNLWKGRLAVGLQAGMVNQAFKGGDVYIPDGDAWEPSDELIPRSDVSGQGLDLGAGVYYEKEFSGNLIYGGISALHLNEAEVDLEEYSYSKQKRTYYFLAGGNIPLVRTLFILQPSLLVKTTMQATQVDVTLRATYSDRFWGGIGYRHGDAISVMLGADIQSIRIGYSYDIGTSPLAKASNGSHELMVSYKLKMDLDKKKKHPHKSIRIL